MKIKNVECKFCMKNAMQHKLHNRRMKGSKGITKTIIRCRSCRKVQDVRK